jgi:hypothetical protein
MKYLNAGEKYLNVREKRVNENGEGGFVLIR